MSAMLLRRRGVVAKPTAGALTYAQTILAEAGLVSFWKLAETSGTAAADSKGSNAGVYTGSPTLNVAPLVTGGDKAVTFSGSGQYVAIAGGASLQVATPTLELWFKGTIASKVVASIADDCFSLSITAGGKAQANMWNGATNRIAVGATTLSSATLYGLAVQWDGTFLSVFVNGVVDGASSFGGDTIGWDATTTSAIASASGGVSPVAATIDDVAYYSAALDDATLLAHYNKGISG